MLTIFSKKTLIDILWAAKYTEVYFPYIVLIISSWNQYENLNQAIWK